MEKKYVNLVFLILCSIILLLFFGTLLRPPKKISYSENRNLHQIPNFKFSSFVLGSFQKDLESAISDQLITSGTLKLQFKKSKASITKRNFEILKMMDDSFCNNYINIESGYYSYKCEDYTIVKPADLNLYSETIDLVADNYNSFFKNYEKYLYFVNSSRTIDFTNLDAKDEIYNYIVDKFEVNNSAQLEINDYNQYKNYFYKTDHHWNHIGSYQGYKDIIKMLLGENEKLLQPLSTKTYDINFYGSASRTTLDFTIAEKFMVYKYDFPEFITYINSKKGEYGKRNLYDDGKYSNDKLAGHYADYYGYDFGEVIYDFNNKKKDNLLIIASSYSNSLNDLIASHFNKTYVIDIRHYEDVFGEVFNPEKYIKGNNISKILYLGDIYTFGSMEFYIGEGE